MHHYIDVQPFTEIVCTGVLEHNDSFFFPLIPAIRNFFVHKMLAFNQYIFWYMQTVLLHYLRENIPITKITFLLMSQSNGP